MTQRTGTTRRPRRPDPMILLVALVLWIPAVHAGLSILAWMSRTAEVQALTKIKPG